MRVPTSVMALSVAASLALPFGAQAQPGTAQLNIEEISCRQMLVMRGDERQFTLIYFHGFVNGQADELDFDGPVLMEATDIILDTCIETPDETLLSVFQNVRG